MNRSLAACILVAALASWGLAACAPGTKQQAVASGESSHPWDKAQQLALQTNADFEKSGARGIAPHVPALEAELANADKALHMPDSPNGPIYRLVDGPAQSLGTLALAMAGGNSENAGRQVVAIPNPYPAISYDLGFYYNEIGKYGEALRVLDAGLALPTEGILGVGESTPGLISERGAALEGLKRWPDVLDNFRKGASIGGLKPEQLALMLRGQGLALTELGRLDEAEKVYRDSLTDAPNNPNALRELAYIAHLRAGGTTVPTGIIATPQPSQGKS